MSQLKVPSTGRVALVGRPNVGKSTIFNRLTGSRRAIVTSVAGTTRDVLAQPVEWQQQVFTLVDTGGVFGPSEDPMREDVAERGRQAVGFVDLVIFVVDGREGPMPGDDDVAQALRTQGVKVVLAINKMDDRRAREFVPEFYRFGFETIVEISAEHGQGIGELLDAVVDRLPEAGSITEEDSESTDVPAIVVVGRPNVGKSSLVNRVLREDRVLVSSIPGTTRDAIDSMFRWHHLDFRIVDTAGIRRPGRIVQGGKVEVVSVVRARHAMDQAEVAVLVIDAFDGVGKRDASIAGQAEAAGCGVVIAANKWDLVKVRGIDFAKEFDERIRVVLKFLNYAPIVHLSALTGERSDRLMTSIVDVQLARRRQVPTGELNRVIERATRTQTPTGVGRGAVHIRYAVQTGVAPPTFTLFTGKGARLHFSYERFIQNRLREAFGFHGTPIRLKVRGRARR